MRFLWCINSLLFVAGCFCTQAQARVPLWAGDDGLFHTTIEVYGHTISGLTVLQTEGADTLRVLFTTFAGPKLLDLRITPTGYETLYAVKQLDRKLILKTLYKDFAVLAGWYLLAGLPTADYQGTATCRREVQLTAKERLYYYYTAADDTMTGAELFAKKKKMLSVGYYYAGGALAQVRLTHHTFNMRLLLLKLKGDEAAGE